MQYTYTSTKTSSNEDTKTDGLNTKLNTNLYSMRLWVKILHCLYYSYTSYVYDEQHCSQFKIKVEYLNLFFFHYATHCVCVESSPSFPLLIQDRQSFCNKIKLNGTVYETIISTSILCYSRVPIADTGAAAAVTVISFTTSFIFNFPHFFLSFLFYYSVHLRFLTYSSKYHCYGWLGW